MKKNVLVTVVFALVFLAGLSVMLYPKVSNYLNSLSQSQVIASYKEALANLSEEDYSEIIQAAQEYNRKLMYNQHRFKMTDEEHAEYFTMLNFTGTGIIGTIEVEMLNINLPIYLGTREEILQVGAGHLEGSSLPIGGPGVHSVITGHRGLPSSTLFTHADRLDIGDMIVLNILKEKLHYQIDHIVIVDPGNFDYLGIDANEDYCTLITCTPYGINSHRMLIRGIRVFPEEGAALAARRAPTEEAKQLNRYAQYGISTIPAILLTVMFSLVRSAVTKSKQKKPAVPASALRKAQAPLQIKKVSDV